MRVLIAEDDLTSRTILTANLKKWGFDVLAVADGLEAQEELKKPEAPQLVILDWLMPGMDGLDVCRKIREAEEATEDECYTYVILLTGCGDPEEIVEGLSAGADDYVVKPYNLQELNVRLKAGRRIVELQQALIEAKNKLRDLSMHDHLTGIFNRRAVLERLSHELSRALREDYTISLAMMDIDFFKKVNDTYGHSAGDDVLKEFVSRVNGVVRPYDILGRYGGEEFLLILIKTSLPPAKSIFERVRCSMEAEPFNAEDNAIKVTVSMGAAQWKKGEKSEDLIKRADEALYRAKESGRNSVALAE